MPDTNQLELLAPAGDFECFKAALDYGADAVYLGGKTFGMRSGPDNFTFDELSRATAMAHEKGKRVYLTCNTLPRNQEIERFEGFIKTAADCGINAAIVTDIGLFAAIKRFVPDLELHVSTQAGIVNYLTAREFYSMGAKRVVLAREMSIDEIAEIRAKTPADLEIEAFVHGAMCVSFSGRCLLSSYIIDRDANRGACAQPCRWGYHLMEEKRPGEFYPVYEDSSGTYILNAKDLSMLEHLNLIAEAGVSSFKIEGRAKSSYYVSVVTNAYRMALNCYKSDPSYNLPQWVKDEVFKVSHRSYCTGFYFGHPKDCQYYKNSGYIREYDVVAIVEKSENGWIYAEQRNKFSVGETVEILSPGKEPVTITVKEIVNEEGKQVESACHAMMKLRIPSDISVCKNSIIRIKK